MNLLRMCLTALLTLLPCCRSASAGAGDVTLRTDHPDYAGEGAFQTVEDCVAFATKEKAGAQDRAIALYNWFLTHQWHLMSPMEWSVPGRVPDSADPGDYETVVFDANRARFSYGYGLCGTVHAWNEPYWKALGFPARRREFPAHVNSEIFYDDAWHAFDTDMAGLLFRSDGVVAGYQDLIRNPELADHGRPPFPHYPFAWPSDFNAMKAGWQKVAQKQQWYSLYNGGYAAHPGIVHLRSGETFTRWYDRDHFGGFSKRRFWHHQKGGPQRSWTYFNNGTPFHNKAESNSRSDASYCNGEFVYEPVLRSAACQEGMAGWSPNIGHRQQSPQLHCRNDQPGHVTFRHFSPYVICGDPLDDANPMSAAATDGLVVEGLRIGHVTGQVSADEGQTWTDFQLLPSPDDASSDNASADAPSADDPLKMPADKASSANDSPTYSTTFRVDLTDFVKGRYGWQIRFTWRGDAGLDRLKFSTTTQVCQAIYPRLTSGGCNVEYHSRPRAVVAVLPNFGLPESDVAAFEKTDLRSPNLNYTPRSRTSRYAYQASDRNPAHVVFRIAAPARLTEVRAAVRYQVPVPPPQGCDFRLELSTDDGASWSPFAAADIPADNEFSSGWLAGRTDISVADATTALVRFHMHCPGRRAALIDARLYGIHDVPASGRVAVEFGWGENGALKTHRTQLDPEVTSATIHVPTKDNIVNRFVRLQALP
ncbi:MAG: hypothetical protein RIK87_13035 [Fuerstiella sp.]